MTSGKSVAASRASSCFGNRIVGLIEKDGSFCWLSEGIEDLPSELIEVFAEGGVEASADRLKCFEEESIGFGLVLCASCEMCDPVDIFS